MSSKIGVNKVFLPQSGFEAYYVSAGRHGEPPGSEGSVRAAGKCLQFQLKFFDFQLKLFDFREFSLQFFTFQLICINLI